MSTPITDNGRYRDAYGNPVEDVPASLARRLEKDREIFRQALIKIYTSPPGEAYQTALDAFRDASEFPGEMHKP